MLKNHIFCKDSYMWCSKIFSSSVFYVFRRGQKSVPCLPLHTSCCFLLFALPFDFTPLFFDFCVYDFLQKNIARRLKTCTKSPKSYTESWLNDDKVNTGKNLRQQHPSWIQNASIFFTNSPCAQLGPIGNHMEHILSKTKEEFLHECLSDNYTLQSTIPIHSVPTHTQFLSRT